ncbi:DUF2946 domain-containing protein [Acinetobacter rudis]|uniref:DUF2946 domain-containing protein n=1 Tax=Acinetobacter rudis TaxID=632955 RepID=A0AAW8J513_9GAMM|nr:DUF2946 domain-containing protein [Acinetobacter rudis]MDQ8934271.1 DUF2946 domain-containing protein [Acinetobacter rudis]MDQ9016421.1 DUF2946 domain-containing protein [Acinetobacter rudis]
MVLGRLLAFSAILLQIAVFIQPLLPEKYQISPVCDTIVHALQLDTSHHEHRSEHSSHTHSDQDLSLANYDTEKLNHEHPKQKSSSSHHHDANHQCQYCVVYAHVVPLPDMGVKEVVVRIQVRLLAFKEAFFHIFFLLKQLFLIPQGRAPPVSFAV